MARAALFDVDGTLVDTNYLHTTAWAEALRQSGRHVPMTDVHRAIGLASDDLIEHLIGKAPDKDTKEQLSAAHKALYAPHFERLHAFDGAARLLRTLAGQGWTVILVTSASGGELQALRRAIDADEVIEDTASAEDVAEGKPAPDPVHKALESAGIPAERAVFVGDSVWDMRAARRAGLACVGVLSGGIARADLEEAGAAAVYRDTAELLDRLEQSPFADVREERAVNEQEERTMNEQEEPAGEGREQQAVGDRGKQGVGDRENTAEGGGAGAGWDAASSREHQVPGGELPEGPGDQSDAVPRDLPDQQAREDDPWDLREPGTDESAEEGGAEEDVPDLDESGTGRRGAPRQGGAHPEHPVPDEPSG
ncbi:haloacid dehalogenase superfamily, subfamily IA, variant 3 with third motif having DD or ED/haloacid dehalogenase superfamily, subfamily IA, variant 1 with third motif having Dx(3-4)D or Dx(3-4)E [Streptomyces indicus]|uniref:Haloacid dehalogenase superfamily, subfamily IA, variant 3 with third motif having DD or ED/haloacid dehalogenase superfamily, subfamily IA, variant 1 with third motif having Dx(3-4)D or Dx(3-4)E n=1 Tax=Streptomyces indicus TaxID=417292 RepID=A0A1G9AA45_9ACTN|nr:haloacid dehalogenase superfamily, subfamily IA, variant 3 with third motif having DD or ED/haloacid dehalogenase superfamily, subfamily IA, variant 1 with third motif having Dx(3-4)D or Dx(3-4)E [Streptomyces indicus]